MSICQIYRIAAYVRHLQENSLAVEILFKEILLGMLSFFRTPKAQEQFRGEAIPELLVGRLAGVALAAQVSGRLLNQGGLSAAIAFTEALEQRQAHEEI